MLPGSARIWAALVESEELRKEIVPAASRGGGGAFLRGFMIHGLIYGLIMVYGWLMMVIVVANRC